ncbi:tRNA (guanosine-2'-O-)-methyltransferase [Thermosulfidibacter takaii ABI70S6]|uniref:tRNA (guanosine(18)-2'-O)-methyltransferase n=1 Tax=Thermosulfidibacter takaii (strain DSM 17441 / JCM 13301 / NBRC 103674 / ABI70S6) TaxID=1298851 RepID=A0A0S3QSQ3_THET7|nr:TrmH family RNA methyltransferase [Thermosulfidibacter takaii]BAT71379.1 tRNA (guanosine-2'-O-)-methyltransferase [Thermosulfidibacter takaii ABI70S6]
MPTLKRCKRYAQVLAKRQPDLVVVMEKIKNPHNASAILRSCDAFGVQDVYIIKEGKSLGVSKTVSSGSYKWLTLHFFEDTTECLMYLKERGFKILTTHLSTQSVDIREFDLTQKIAIVIGSELEGVSEEALSLSDANIIVPMVGFVQSFNVSVATALILYEAFRQRDAKGLYSKPRMEKARRKELYREWVERDK